MGSEHTNKAPVERQRNNWFVVERPTDSGTVFVKPPVDGTPDAPVEDEEEDPA